LLPEKDTLAVRAKTQDLILDENEIAVAVWAFEHKQPAGRGTDTLPAARVRYQPLVTAHGVVGVLGAKPPATEKFISPEQRQLLESYGSLAALAIERAQLEEQAKKMQLTHVTEELQNALLNSISHDLRTPLSSITGAFSGLMEAETAKKGTVHFDKKNRLELIETGMEESARLNRLVGNLLDMSRLEGGSLNLHMQPEDLQEVIGAALTRLASLLSNREVNMEIEPELPLIPMDASLIEQVLVNLLDNAVKFSKPDSPIEIRAYYTGGEVSISVSNLGEGIPPEDLEKIFDKFYRIRRKEDIGGTGLGLSICKGFVEAHGGRIWAQNNPKGGAILTFTLPLNQGTSKEKTRG
jgi:two-component system sensor histidine kinase KdpD